MKWQAPLLETGRPDDRWQHIATVPRGGMNQLDPVREHVPELEENWVWRERCLEALSPELRRYRFTRATERMVKVWRCDSIEETVPAVLDRDRRHVWIEDAGADMTGFHQIGAYASANDWHAWPGLEGLYAADLASTPPAERTVRFRYHGAGVTIWGRNDRPKGGKK